MTHDRLDDFGIYKLASLLFDDYWADSEILMKDERGLTLVRQQTRSIATITISDDKRLSASIFLGRLSTFRSLGRLDNFGKDIRTIASVNNC